MLRRIVLHDGLTAYRSPALEEVGVPHAFTTRLGPRGSEFDVGPLSAAPALRRDLRRIAGALDVPIGDAAQVHGARVVDDAAAASEGRPEADALVTAERRMILVRTADCVPVLLASDDGRRVAAVHAGWRGLIAEVLPRAIEALGVGAGHMVAAVGACLSLERFEVGPEVADAFRAADLGGAVHTDRGPRPHVDLRAATALQLERMGLARFDVASPCTWNDSELYSFRRDVTHGGRPHTGRLAALIGPRRVAEPRD